MAHRFVLFPVLALAVGVTAVGLRALRTPGQVVTMLAAVEAAEDRDPQFFFIATLVFLAVGLGNDVAVGVVDVALRSFSGGAIRRGVAGDVHGAAMRASRPILDRRFFLFYF